MLFRSTYNGGNNYLLRLKQKQAESKKFYPTRAQAEYIVNFHTRTPKVARKWVDLDEYFAKKISDERLFTKIATKIYVEKLLVEKDTSYHIWGKVFSGETLHDFWLPKGAIVKTHNVEKVDIDYSKYSHRPPLEHQKEAIEKYLSLCKFYPVSFGPAASMSSPEQAKVAALEEFVDYCKNLNQRMPIKVGFSDDDKKNIDLISQHFGEPQDLVSMTIKYTGKQHGE